MQDILYLVNPHAASGRAARTWSALRREHASLRNARCIMASTPAEATQALRDQLDDGVRRLVAVGGDGTIHCAANAVLQSTPGVSLGIVPIGTGSDIARGLGLERRPHRALERALSGEPRLIDAVYFSQGEHAGWVVNIASAGVSGIVAGQVNALAHRRRWTYLWSALRSLARYSPAAYRIELDGTCWFEGPLLLCAVANGTRFARGMRIAPQARLDDGLADVVLVRPAPFARVLQWLPRLYTGSHLRAPFVMSTRARHIQMIPLEGTASFEADGEPLPAGPMEFAVMPRALELIV